MLPANRAKNAEDRARVIAALADAWERTPELRLTQLACGLVGLERFFYVEDFELEAKAMAWANVCDRYPVCVHRQSGKACPSSNVSAEAGEAVGE